MSSVNQHADDIVRLFKDAAVEGSIDADLNVLEMTKTQLETVSHIFGMVIATIYVDKQHFEVMAKTALRAKRAA